jgi:hypothetical protein
MTGSPIHFTGVSELALEVPHLAAAEKFYSIELWPWDVSEHLRDYERGESPGTL